MVDPNTSRRNPLIMPGLDLALLLTVITLGTACLGWLTSRPGVAEGKSLPAMDSRELERRVAAATAENNHRRRQLDEDRAAADTLQQDLKAARDSRPDLPGTQAERDRTATEAQRLEDDLGRQQENLNALDKLRKELQEKLRRLDQFKQTLEEKQRQLGADLQSTKDDQVERQRLEKQLADAIDKTEQLQTEQRRLREEIAKIKQAEIATPTVRIETHPRFQLEEKRSPVFIMLAEGTVMPLRAPYFKVTKESDSVTYTRQQLGETIDQAFQPGSDFCDTIDDISPSQEYVFFLVDTESFETFRAARTFLRRRKIDCGWTPVTALNVRMVASGGADPGTL